MHLQIRSDLAAETLSMKRKRTEEVGSSRSGKKDFTNMSAADILQEIDGILGTY